MRARNIKPSIYKNELLAIADPLYTVIFTGLWCAADREGRLEDRPAKLHMEINPGRDFSTTERSLDWLTENEFIRRYAINGKRYIQVIKFFKHQNPHHKEPASDIPEEPNTPGSGVMHEGKTLGSTAMHDASIDQKPSKGTSSPPVHEGQTLLIPDSGFLIPDSPSLIPDSGYLIPDPRPPAGEEALAAQAHPKVNGHRGSRIPDDFVLTDERRAYALSKFVDAGPAFEAFVAYWRSKARDNTKLDWDATWHSWVLKDAKDSKQRSAPRKTRYDELWEQRHADETK